jgi:ribosomal protein S19
MARSHYKFLYFNKRIIKLMIKGKARHFKRLRPRLYCRSSTIPSKLNFNSFLIHKGFHFATIYNKILHKGRKLGEFSFTRKPFHFPIKDKSKKKLFRR